MLDFKLRILLVSSTAALISVSLFKFKVLDLILGDDYWDHLIEYFLISFILLPMAVAVFAYRSSIKFKVRNSIISFLLTILVMMLGFFWDLL